MQANPDSRESAGAIRRANPEVRGTPLIGLDATYSFGRNLSGVGVYSREMVFGLARRRADQRFALYYRPNRFLKAFGEAKPANASRRLLHGTPRVDLFHALNQRVDARAKRTISTFHDLFVMTGDYSSGEFRARFTEQARRAAERSDAIIAVSRFTAKQVEQLLGVEPSRIHVVPHGVVPHDVVHEGAAVGARHREIASSGPRENVVLFVGAIQRRKNTGSLVRAFERMPKGWRLKLAGAADGFGAAEELKAVENSVRRADIDVLGYVTAADLAALYQRARIFAFPSLDEGFGIPVLEAMANGVPVVTSSVSALPEIAGDAALLVDPKNTEELTEALIRLAADEPLRQDLTRRGLERAKEFTWEIAVDRTWQVYASLLPGVFPGVG